MPEIRGLEDTRPGAASLRSILAPTFLDTMYVLLQQQSEPPCVKQVEPLLSAEFGHGESASYFTGHQVCVQ